MPADQPCTADGCHNPATHRCGGPDDSPQGCTEPYCDHHLYPTDRYGDLCCECYGNVDDPTGEDTTDA